MQNTIPAGSAPGPQTVLIVDDDKEIQNLIGHFLRREKFGVATADNGWEALEHLRLSGNLPSLILLDLRMPVMDGWKFRTVQKSDPRIARIPVIVITSTQTIQDDIASIDAAAFFKKPLQFDMLLRTIRTHLK